MRQLIYILTLAFVLYSCNNRTNNQNASNPVSLTTETNTEKPKEIGDSIYKIGDFLFEAKKNAKFEFIANGQKTKLKTEGDTLYSDEKITMLGDIQEIVSSGIYRRFAFKSKFDNYKVDKVYKGQLASPNFTTDPNAKRFISMIKQGCKEGVNFAGHYTIVEWGCGTLCAEMAIVDRISGKIIYSQIPFDTADGHSGVDYKIDSRMLIINTAALSEFDDYEQGYRRFDFGRNPAVYEMKNGSLKQIE